MATIAELRTRRTKIVSDAQKLALKSSYTSEERQRIDRMLADVQDIEKTLAILESESRSTRPPRSQPGEGVTAEKREQERTSFLHYMRTGETRDLMTGGTGAPFVPQGYRDTLTEAAKLWGQLAASVKNVQTSNGEPTRFPLANDSMNAFTVLGESLPVSEADPVLSGVLSQVDKIQSGIVKISREFLADAAFDLDSWLRQEFGKRYWRGVSAAITNGTSTGNVASINSVAVAGVTTASPTAVGYNEMVAMYGALEAAYIPSASWVMNSQTRAYFLGVLDNYGRPLYIPSVNTDSLDTILGRPVVINQYAPSIAAATTPILLGSLTDAYTLRTCGEVEVMRLNERYSDTYEVGFQAFARISGFGTDAGTHPLIKLSMHA